MISLPTPPQVSDPALQQFLISMKAALESVEQSTVSTETLTATVAELVATTIPTAVASTTTSSIDTSTPPPLSGLGVAASVASTILTWEVIPYGNAAYTNIYRAAADDFSIATVVGTSRSLIYVDQVPDGSNYYYWIKSVSEAGIEGPYNQAAGTQQSADFWPTDSVAASRVVAATLAALSANLGTVTAGLIQSPDQTFTIDLDSKEILITGAAGQASDDYTVMRNGVLESWKWTGSTHAQSKALVLLENGVANNGVTITLTGYYAEAPGIVVSPANIGSYDAGYSAQDQNLVCEATNITEYATGRYRFDVSASLSLDAGAFSATLGYSSGVLTSSPITSGTYTTPANCDELTLYHQFLSYKGTGTAPNYYYRKVIMSLYYRPVGDTTWIFAKDQTYYPGASLDYVSGSLEYGFSVAGEYEYYVSAAYTTHTGTFASGSSGYEYDQVTKSASTASDSFTSPGAAISKTITADTGSYSAPSGWTIYDVDYSWNWAAAADVYTWVGTTVTAKAFSSWGGCTVVNGTPSSCSTSGSKTATSTSYSRTYISNTISLTISGGSIGDGDASGTISNAQAVIKIRKAITNSTTPANALLLNTVGYNLTSGTVLAAGTMNWLAIGR